MKQRILWGIITLGVLLASCHTDTPTRKLLRRADSLLNAACPDSAWTLLNSLADSMPHEPEATRMYYTLLTIKAQDKAYIPHTSDSLIRQVLHYYQDRNDKTHLPEALYYAGRVYSDLKNAPQALGYFQKAIDVMQRKKQINYKLSSLIYSQMGELFFYQELYEKALVVIQKAYQCDLLLGDSTNLIYDLRDIGRAFATKEIKDSAIYYYNRAGEMALQIQDSILLSMVYGELAGFYVDWKNYDKAYEKLQIARKTIDTLSMSMYYNNIADYYYYTNQLDSARYYYQKKTSINSYLHKASGFRGLAKITRQQGELSKALDYYELFMLYDDSLKQSIRTESIRKIDALYNYQQYEKENRMLKKENFKHKSSIFFLTLIVVFLLMVFAIFWQKHKRKEQAMLLQQEKLKRQQEIQKQYSQEQIEKNNELIKILSRQLQQAEKDKDLLRRDLLLAKKEQVEKENQRIETIQEIQRKAQENLYETDVYKKFQNVANNKENPTSITPNDWNRLQEYIDETYNGFTLRLKELYALISDKELQVCLLIKIGIMPTQMATILFCSKQDISSIRSRLYEKLTGKKGTSKQCDQLILDL